MNPGRQLQNTYHHDEDKEICVESAELHATNLSAQRANLIAVCFYLNELQKRNLVTPSISRPFPSSPVTEEKLLLHKAHRKLQQKRILKIQTELSLLKLKGVPVCYDTLRFRKLKLKKKLSRLTVKFQHTPVNANKSDSERCPRNIAKDKTVANKKSRQRYIARRYKNKLFSYRA